MLRHPYAEIFNQLKWCRMIILGLRLSSFFLLLHFFPPENQIKGETFLENKHETREFKNWLALVCYKWEFFPPSLPRTGSDLQCSASLLLGRFSQISESCFSSEPAGSRVFALHFQCPWSSSVETFFFFFFFFFTFWIFSGRNLQQNSTGRAAPQQPFLLFPPLSQMCFHGLCVHIPLWRIVCSSGFYSAGIGLWWQRQNRPQLSTNAVTLPRKGKKSFVRWPVPAERRLPPALLLLCYRRGGSSRRLGHVCQQACEEGRLRALVGGGRRNSKRGKGMLHRTKYNRFRNESVTSVDELLHGLSMNTKVSATPQSAAETPYTPPTEVQSSSGASLSNAPTSHGSDHLEDGGTTLCTLINKVSNLKFSNSGSLLGIKGLPSAVKDLAVSKLQGGGGSGGSSGSSPGAATAAAASGVGGSLCSSHSIPCSQQEPAVSMSKKSRLDELLPSGEDWNPGGGGGLVSKPSRGWLHSNEKISGPGVTYIVKVGSLMSFLIYHFTGAFFQWIF